MPTLPQYRMLFERITPGQEDTRLGLRSGLGGTPKWVQDDETPTCIGCGSQMSFVGQIDSISQDEKHNPHRIDCFSHEPKFMFGDVGIIYVFFCFECLEAISVFQCG